MTIKEIKTAYMINLTRAAGEKNPNIKKNYEREASHYRGLLNTYLALDKR